MGIESLKTWDEIEKELCTPEEIAESKARAAIICELAEARNAGKITQEQFEELIGYRKPKRFLFWKRQQRSTIEEVIDALAEIGKTLAVVPIDNDTLEAINEVVVHTYAMREHLAGDTVPHEAINLD